MAKNIEFIPYTELQERILHLGRIPENSKGIVRGIIQDMYVRDIPSKYDWTFLFASSSIISIEEKKTGTCSVNTGSTTVSFSGTTITTDMTGRKIKITGNDAVYDFTYLDSTGGTLNPPFTGDANASGNSYSIYQPKYALAGDFDRLPKDGGVYKWIGGRKEVLKEEYYQEYMDNYQASPGDPETIRLSDFDTAGCQTIEFRPAPSKEKVYGYDYLRTVKPLKESSDGTVTISANGTTVTGSTSCRFTEMNTGDYIRINAFGEGEDSSWYRVNNISHNSSMTISTFANSGVTNTNYVISSIPQYPAKLQPAIMYGTLTQVAVDQNDDSIPLYNIKYAEVMSDSKRLYVTRTYSKQIPSLAEDYMYRR